MISVTNSKFFLKVTHLLNYKGETIDSNKTPKGFIFYHNVPENILEIVKKTQLHYIRTQTTILQDISVPEDCF